MSSKASKLFKMPHISGKSLHLSENDLKNLEFFEKALHHFKKASIPIKMSSERAVIFEEASDFLLKPLKMSLKSLVFFIKASHFLFKCSEQTHSTLKKPQFH
jgi:hypothetical protein